MYSNFVINNQVYDLTHLNPSHFCIEIDGVEFSATLQFSNHCFTDEKENGPLFSRRLRKNGSYEERFFSIVRYEDTKILPNILRNILIENRSYYVVPFRPKHSNDEQYHYLDNGYYAIFFYINNIDLIKKTFNIYVISAYDKTTYSSNLPKGKAFKLSWVLSKRVKGEKVI